MKRKLLLEVGDGVRGVVVLHGEVAVVAPEVGLIGVEGLCLVEQGAGLGQVFALLGLVDLADEVSGGGIVFRDGRRGREEPAASAGMSWM